MTSPVGEAAAAALRGELIVLPTDTVYGIGTRPDDPDATGRLFEAKSRSRQVALPVLASSVDEVVAVAVLDERAERLAREHWPGGLTLVLPRAPGSRGWDLGGDPEIIGVRVPRHPLARAVLLASGPLAVTSANRSGEPTPASCAELVDTFGDLVSVYLCQDEPLEGEPSTVLDLAHGEPRVMREGSVPRESIDALLAG